MAKPTPAEEPPKFGERLVSTTEVVPTDGSGGNITNVYSGAKPIDWSALPGVVYLAVLGVGIPLGIMLWKIALSL